VTVITISLVIVCLAVYAFDIVSYIEGYAFQALTNYRIPMIKEFNVFLVCDLVLIVLQTTVFVFVQIAVNKWTENNFLNILKWIFVGVQIVFSIVILAISLNGTTVRASTIGEYVSFFVAPVILGISGIIYYIKKEF